MEDRLLARAHVTERVRVVRVRVEELPRDVVVRVQIAPREEEPQFVADDRPAESGIEVPAALDTARGRQASRLRLAASTTDWPCLICESCDCALAARGNAAQTACIKKTTNVTMCRGFRIGTQLQTELVRSVVSRFVIEGRATHN